MEELKSETIGKTTSEVEPVGPKDVKPNYQNDLSHNHNGINSPLINYNNLIMKPIQTERTATSVDLSGAAATLICLHTERKCTLLKAYLLYTEASSADAGITIKIGKETDDDYYYTGTTEVSQSQWYSKEVTLLKRDIAKGDTVTLTSAGSKTGTGEIMLIIEYKFIEEYSG